MEEGLENRPAPGADVVERKKKACQHGADTAAGARHARSAASAGVSAPSCSRSWKQSSSVVGCLASTLVIVVTGEVGRDGTRRRC